MNVTTTESESQQPQENQVVQSQQCGPGTILKDGQCILDTTAPIQDTKSMSKEFVIAIIAAFLIAIIVMFVLWAIGKAGRAKH